MRIAEVAQRFVEVAIKIRRVVDRNVVSAGDSQMDQTTLAVRKSSSGGFTNAGESERKVGIILSGDQTVQCCNGQRCITLRLIARLPICSASCCHRVRHCSDTERLGGQQTDLTRADVSSFSDPV